MAQAVKSYGEAGMRVKQPVLKQPAQKGSSVSAVHKAGKDAIAAATQMQEDGSKGK